MIDTKNVNLAINLINNEVHRAEEYVDFPPALERPEKKAAIEGEQG